MGEVFNAIMNPRSFNDDPFYPEKVDHLWILKATGLAITEIILRIMAWLPTYDPAKYENTQFPIVVGPNVTLAEKLIKRIRIMFWAKQRVVVGGSRQEININGCTITAYPSNHVDAFRSLEAPKFIFLDEADFFEQEAEQEDILYTTERYIAKSRPKIVIVSTPDEPEGFMWKIDQQKEEECLYKRMWLHYTRGVGKVYSEEDIELAQASHTFGKEYCLEYGGEIGDLFNIDAIITCQNRGNIYGLETLIAEQLNPRTIKVIGFDAGFGSSKFAITAIEWLPAVTLNEMAPQLEQINSVVDTKNVAGIMRVIYSMEKKKAIYGDMINEVVNLSNEIRARKIYTGAVNPECIRDVKIGIGERVDYESMVARAKTEKRPVEQYMQVVPIPEGEDAGNLNYHARSWVESSLMAIHPSYKILIGQMKSAKTKDTGALDKKKVKHDSLDSLKNALWYFKRDNATGAEKYAIYVP